MWGKYILEGFWDVCTGWWRWILVLCPGSKVASLIQSASADAGTPAQAVAQQSLLARPLKQAW